MAHHDHWTGEVSADDRVRASGPKGVRQCSDYGLKGIVDVRLPEPHYDPALALRLGALSLITSDVALDLHVQ
jgi:hypothetical protein